MHQVQNQTCDSRRQSQECRTHGGQGHQEEKSRQGRRPLQMIPLFKLSQSSQSQQHKNISSTDALLFLYHRHLLQNLVEILVHPSHQALSHVLLGQLGVWLGFAGLLDLLSTLVFYLHCAPHFPFIVCHIDLFVGYGEEAGIILVEDVVLRFIILDIAQIVIPFLLDLLSTILLNGRNSLHLLLYYSKIHQFERVELIVLDFHRFFTPFALVYIPYLRKVEIDLLQHLEG